jgi:Holliday junction resolvase RusA-like endonuclease
VTEQRLWVPRQPSLNDWIKYAKSGRGSGNGYSRVKKRETDLVAKLAVDAGLQPVDRAFFEFTWIEPSTRRDPDNLAIPKAILDGLVNAGVLPDDSWKHVAGFRHEWRVGSPPGVAVLIKSA